MAEMDVEASAESALDEMQALFEAIEEAEADTTSAMSSSADLTLVS